jgi:hypothetical protein
MRWRCCLSSSAIVKHPVAFNRRVAEAEGGARRDERGALAVHAVVQVVQNSWTLLDKSAGSVN